MPETTITANINDANLKRKLAQIKGKVSSSDIVLVGSLAVKEVIRRHVAELAISRHKTAASLLASPTQHYKTQLINEPVVSGQTASIGISIRGISRAYHDLDIRPIKSKALTIPIHSMAYGVSVKEQKARGRKIFRLRGTDILAMKAPQAATGFIA